MWLASSSARLLGGGKAWKTTKDREGDRLEYQMFAMMPLNHSFWLFCCATRVAGNYLYYLLCAFFDEDAYLKGLVN